MFEVKVAAHQAYFFTSARGNKVLMCDGAKFREHTRTVAGKVRWRCTSHDKFGCKAAVYTIGNQIVYVKDYPFFSLSSRGVQILTFRGCKYRQNFKSAHKVTWRCNTHNKFGCRASVHTVDDEIVFVKNVHTTMSCVLLNYSQRKNSTFVWWLQVQTKQQIIEQQSIFANSRGKLVLIVGGYKYRVNSRSKLSNKVRWRCTSHAKYKCNVVIHTLDNEIVYTAGEHKLDYD
ncbi:hypothetical protein MSG28_008204 [Choristoneura fumiferana]|uniref:Uncharacterized protein n=1 Tax=Choristoneura fumiferana TaxID=7141 RepID=A0ACC0JAJ6_CHOFU|nr:hypothetical protein MSG28_008204 [Choristoneura fumiferana]